MSDFNSFLINENNNLKAQVSEELRKISFVFDKFKNTPVYWIYYFQNGTLEKIESINKIISTEQSYGLAAISRNLFENFVVLKLFNIEKCYALWFAKHFFEQQIQMLRQSIAKITSDANLYAEIQSRIDAEIGEIQYKNKITENIDFYLAEIKRINKEADDVLENKFTIYSHEAKLSGYGYFSNTIRNKYIPLYEERIKFYEEEKYSLEEDKKILLSERERELIKKISKSKWNQKAEIVGMNDDYEYIYSYTSKFLHAEGINIFTEKMLSDGEINILSKYIKICFNNIHKEIRIFLEKNRLNVI